MAVANLSGEFATIPAVAQLIGLLTGEVKSSRTESRHTAQRCVP